MSIDLPNVVTALILTSCVGVITYIGLSARKPVTFFAAICAILVLAIGILVKAFL